MLDVVSTLGVQGSLTVVGDDLRAAYGDNVEMGGVAHLHMRPHAEMRMGAMAMPGMSTMR